MDEDQLSPGRGGIVEGAEATFKYGVDGVLVSSLVQGVGECVRERARATILLVGCLPQLREMFGCRPTFGCERGTTRVVPSDDRRRFFRHDRGVLGVDGEACLQTGHAGSCRIHRARTHTLSNLPAGSDPIRHWIGDERADRRDMLRASAVRFRGVHRGVNAWPCLETHRMGARHARVQRRVRSHRPKVRCGGRGGDLGDRAGEPRPELAQDAEHRFQFGGGLLAVGREQFAERECIQGVELPAQCATRLKIQGGPQASHHVHGRAQMVGTTGNVPGGERGLRATNGEQALVKEEDHELPGR